MACSSFSGGATVSRQLTVLTKLSVISSRGLACPKGRLQTSSKLNVPHPVASVVSALRCTGFSKYQTRTFKVVAAPFLASFPFYDEAIPVYSHTYLWNFRMALGLLRPVLRQQSSQGA